MEMTSSRPYLIRALYEWIVANDCSPYLLVNTTVEGASIPREYATKDKIILNVSPRAVKGLNLGNQHIEFGARFGGKPYEILVPIRAVMAIYALENGRGMVFNDDDDDLPPPEDEATRSRARLKVVK